MERLHSKEACERELDSFSPFSFFNFILARRPESFSIYTNLCKYKYKWNDSTARRPVRENSTVFHVFFVFGFSYMFSPVFSSRKGGLWELSIFSSSSVFLFFIWLICCWLLLIDADADWFWFMLMLIDTDWCWYSVYTREWHTLLDVHFRHIYWSRKDEIVLCFYHFYWISHTYCSRNHKTTQ